MSVLRKTLGIINALIVMAVSMGAMIYFARPDAVGWLRNYLETHLLNDRQVLLYWLLGSWLVFVLAFVTLVIFSIRIGGFRGVSRRNEIGEYKVSLHAIENIALAETRRISGLKVLKTPVQKMDKGVFVTVKASAMMDENIPELSQTVQDRVKMAIEKSTEINVLEVRVLISDIFVPNKPRVE
ncbi:MAG: alkaline shock response membrane anchor protein AmaP [Clostridia bacterium]